LSRFALLFVAQLEIQFLKLMKIFHDIGQI
jgi:hypothetical protein